MPSGLFKKEGERWVVGLPNPPKDVNDYQGDHAQLLVRYMFLMTPDEQRRLLATSPPPAAGPAQATAQNAHANKWRLKTELGWFRPEGASRTRKSFRTTIAKP
jgi:hypothetical protein